MIIETERLILRELEDSDFDAFYEVLDDSDIREHYPYTFDESRVRKWITNSKERYRIFGFGLWAVVLKESGILIGDCGISMQNINGVIKPEIGYHLCKKYQHNGYAKEAARKVRDWTFENNTFNVLFSYMKKTNVASYSTAVANGMHLIDEFTDEENEQTLVYAITREEWKQLNK